MNEKRSEVKEAITNFIMKICTKERYTEIRRQILCDKNDFEPYVAFKRLTRDSSEGINSKNLTKFQKENMLEITDSQARMLINHYRSPISPIIKYKEFLEIVLPRENSDLRAFITQRECFEIKEGEYLSYDTELALSYLLGQEIQIFCELADEKRKLDKLGLNSARLIFEVDKVNSRELNFQNLNAYLSDSGVNAFDNEIISFLRKVDRDDDGVINLHELERFMKLFDFCKDSQIPGRKGICSQRSSITNDVLRSVSPARKIVKNPVSLIPKKKRVAGILSHNNSKDFRPKKKMGPRVGSMILPRTPIKSPIRGGEKRQSSKKSSVVDFCLLNRSSVKKNNEIDLLKQDSGEKDTPKLSKNGNKITRFGERKSWISPYKAKIEFSPIRSSPYGQQKVNSFVRQSKDSTYGENVFEQTKLNFDDSSKIQAKVIDKTPIKKTEFAKSQILKYEKSPILNFGTKSDIKDIKVDIIPSDEKIPQGNNNRKFKNLQDSKRLICKKQMTTKYRKVFEELDKSRIIPKKSEPRMIEEKPQEENRFNHNEKENDKSAEKTLKYYEKLGFQRSHSPAFGEKDRDQLRDENLSKEELVYNEFNEDEEQSEAEMERRDGRRRSTVSMLESISIEPMKYTMKSEAPSEESSMETDSETTSHSTYYYEEENKENISCGRPAVAKQNYLYSNAGLAEIKANRETAYFENNKLCERSDFSKSTRSGLTSLRSGIDNKKIKIQTERVEKIASLISDEASGRRISFAVDLNQIKALNQNSLSPSFYQDSNIFSKKDKKDKKDKKLKEQFPQKIDHLDPLAGNIKESIVFPIQNSPSFQNPISEEKWESNQHETPPKAPKEPLKSERSEWRPNFETNGISPKQSGTFAKHNQDMLKEPELKNSARSNKSKEDTSRVDFRNMINVENLKSSPQQYNNVEQSNRTDNLTYRNSEQSSVTYTGRSGAPSLSQNLQQFGKLIFKIIKEERLLEIIKRELVANSDFNLRKLFRKMINSTKSIHQNPEKLSLSQLKAYLSKTLDMEHPHPVMFDLFNSFDTHKSQSLGFSQFVEMLCPLDNTYALKIDENDASSTEFNETTLHGIGRCFKRLIEIRGVMLEVREFIRNNLIDLDALFEEIDLFQRGYLTKIDFERILTIVLPDYKESALEEIGIFMRRVDLDKDTRVNYKDFYLFFSV
jgi:Ca2+-binding EF-hand superfamily protein